MAHRNRVMVFMAVVLLAIASGCSDSSRNESAQIRWQQRMDQARVEAAQKGLDQGRLTYAQRILRECRRCSDPKSPLAGQAEQIRVKIENEQNRYAKAEQPVESPEETAY